MSDKIQLLNDNPLKFTKDDSEYKLDGLNFKTYTKVITNAIVNTDTPFTIGVFGEWGKGKTSFLEIIKQKIEKENKEDKFTTVWFNAWQYENEEHPIVPLIAVIIKALEEKEGKIKKGFESFVNTLRSVAYGFSMEASGKDPLGNELKMQLNSKDMIDRYEQLMASALLDKSLYFNAFEKLESLKEIEDKKIVVFIDDLDRCLPPNAVKLLESIKLVLAQKGFVFVLGMAKEVIEGHLAHRYEKEFGIKDGKHGESYLEKIIQLPFTLPKFTRKVENLVDSLFEKVDNGDNIENIKEVITAIATHSKVTPRLLVRIINQAKIHSEIDKELENENVYADMYAAYVFVLLLDIFYPDEYKILTVEVQSKLDNIFKEEDEENRVEKDEKKVDKSSFNFLKDSIAINKCLDQLLKTKVGKYWLENESLRERTTEFIDIATDMSEEEIKEQVEKKIENQTLEEIRNKLLALKGDPNFDIPDYKDFVEVEDKNGNRFEWSKYLVTNKWYDESGLKRKKYLNGFNSPFQPVVGVTYFDADKFCKYLNNLRDGYIYSLPTRDQFIFICGNKGKFSFPWGNEYNNKLCNNGEISLNSSSTVGFFEKATNENGIYDISGNVWKWTKTKYRDGRHSVVGGGWDYLDPELFNVKSSILYKPYFEYEGIGFYIVRNKDNS